MARSPQTKKGSHVTPAMSAEYRCLYGLSSSVPGLEEKHHYRAVNKDWSFLTVVGKSDRCYWFVFEKLDRIYHAPNIPRYVEADQLEFIKPFLDRYVSQNVQFQALWERRIAATLTSLEEAQYSRWTHGRIVCLGDSIHKMTPNMLVFLFPFPLSPFPSTCICSKMVINLLTVKLQWPGR